MVTKKQMIRDLEATHKGMMYMDYWNRVKVGRENPVNLVVQVNRGLDQIEEMLRGEKPSAKVEFRLQQVKEIRGRMKDFIGTYMMSEGLSHVLGTEGDWASLNRKTRKLRLKFLAQEEEQ